MNHIFGRKKKAGAPEEAPDLGAAVGRIDEKVSSMDAKIKQCDAELRDYKQKARQLGAGGAATCHTPIRSPRPPDRSRGPRALPSRGTSSVQWPS